ncbi:MAG: hypothetical protein DRJ51_06400 [Thermoprotei archaeon]|nr:MAG: hypothetical protein DRJ51_06400 [Thermoprotei archaeon]
MREWRLAPLLVILLAVAPLTAAQPTLTTSKPSYAPGETITLIGSGWTPGARVAVEVRDPTDSTVYVEQVEVGGGGAFTITFRLKLTAREGLYTVYASSTAGETAVTTFTVTAAPFYPMIVTGVATKDMAGNLKSEFERGEMVIVEASFTYPGGPYYPEEMSYLVIIELFYGGRPMGLTLTRGTIRSGETKSFGGGIAIRHGAPTGTYTVEVYVWNGFPSEMGANWAALAEMETTTITVNP